MYIDSNMCVIHLIYIYTYYINHIIHSSVKTMVTKTTCQQSPGLKVPKVPTGLNQNACCNALGIGMGKCDPMGLIMIFKPT